MSIPAMTAQKLKDFVLGYCDQRIYTWFDCEPRDVPQMFMILSLMEDAEERLKGVGCVWEELCKAGPMSCNGRPMFMSCHLMNEEDWEICRKAIAKELKRRENIQLDMQLELKEERNVSGDKKRS